MSDERSHELIELGELINYTHRLILTEFDTILLVLFTEGNIPQEYFIALDQRLETLMANIEQNIVTLGGISELPSDILANWLRLMESGRNLYILYLMDPNDEEFDEHFESWDGITEVNPDDDFFDGVYGLEDLNFASVEVLV